MRLVVGVCVCMCVRAGQRVTPPSLQVTWIGSSTAVALTALQDKQWKKNEQMEHFFKNSLFVCRISDFRPRSQWLNNNKKDTDLEFYGVALGEKENSPLS